MNTATEMHELESGLKKVIPVHNKNLLPGRGGLGPAGDLEL